MVMQMGLTIFIECDIDNNTYIKIYKCSNCNTFIYETRPTHIANLSYDGLHNLSRIPKICSCGEKFIKFIPIYDVIIDMMVSK